MTLGTVGRYHGASTRRAWLITTVVGTVGWVVGGWNLIPLLGQDSFAMALLSFAIMGLIGSFFIALIVVSKVQMNSFKKRNKYFAEKYLPALRNFCCKRRPR